MICALGFAVAATGYAAADDRSVRIYLDVDRTTSPESARSIEMGVRTALADPELHPDGVNFEVVPLDHRSNTKRSYRHMLQYLDDENALVIFGGQQSPPYLTYQQKINERGVLLLLPWSAAGPLTRTGAPKNWIFRASVDDTKAGGFLVEQAMVQGGCNSVAMVLFNSGWGRANHETISTALTEHGHPDAPVFFFEANADPVKMRILAREVSATGADCVILVADGTGGVAVAQALAQLPTPPRVYSHWGITGVDFATATTRAQRDALSLQFLQSCLPFGQQDSAINARVTSAARTLFPESFTTLEELNAPVGFVHGHDLALILLAAMRQTDLTGPIAQVRDRLRTSLEGLEEPVPGLLKTYDRPFSAEGFDSHEALGAADLCMASYGEDGKIVFLPGPNMFSRRK